MVGVRALRVANWTFEIYLFIVGYAVTLFLLAALLLPDSMHDYKSYEDFFISRRAWFFGVMATTYLFDIADTLIKGEAHFAHFADEYLIRTPLLVALCIATPPPPKPISSGLCQCATLLYQVSWIWRLFDTIV